MIFNFSLWWFLFFHSLLLPKILFYYWLEFLMRVLFLVVWSFPIWLLLLKLLIGSFDGKQRLWSDNFDLLKLTLFNLLSWRFCFLYNFQLWWRTWRRLFRWRLFTFRRRRFWLTSFSNVCFFNFNLLKDLLPFYNWIFVDLMLSTFWNSSLSFS